MAVIFNIISGIILKKIFWVGISFNKIGFKK